jgi:hypothetical protein
MTIQLRVSVEIVEFCVTGLEKCATTPVDPTSRSPNSSIEIQPKKPQVIPPKELEHLRARLRAQQKEKLSRPLLYQTFIPELLHASDVRQLLLYALIGGDASGLKPEWCTLVRWQKLSQVVVFAIEGMTQADWEDYSVVSPALKNFLDVGGRLEPQDETALSRNLLEYPLSNRSLKRIGRLSNGDVESRGKIFDLLLIHSINQSINRMQSQSAVMSNNQSINQSNAKPISHNVQQSINQSRICTLYLRTSW